ncbi:MAG: SHOCT domain-containing protein [Opitutaceae bacterium]
MQGLTQQGHDALQDIAGRYNISLDSACSMFQSVNNGGGTMAQFSIPELGSGQWMQGGMTMCGDMFNHGLQAMVSNLCGELSNLMATTQVYKPRPAGASGMGGNSWWPSDLGSPNSSGGQNNVRYAYFSNSRRLAIDVGGVVSIYDTLDHQIGGVQQQQGGGSSVTFTSQYGTVDTVNLPLISGPGSSSRSEPAPQPAQQSVPEPQIVEAPKATPKANENVDDIYNSIQKLGDLYNAGVLTQQEFESKKAELLSRI